ncbi:LOW QUALITY PROTEIN: Protein CBG02666, partial [Caenorhabditis briggsae]
MTSTNFLLLMLALINSAQSIVEFDNHILEEPEVSCQSGFMALKVNTEKSPPSHVFVKGHFRKEGCSFSNTANATFDFSKCDVMRQREANPKGMAYTATVVVQFHPLFTTKVDRAYKLRCFYKEAEKSVGAEVSVSDPTPIQLEDESPQPTCSYTIHKESPNGPIAKFAQLGDVLYHVWECDSETYQMEVYNCDVIGGEEYSKKVIGENGCSEDIYIMPNLIYNENRTKAFVNSNAFNFPDQNNVRISCKISVCATLSGTCHQPKCDASASSIDEISPIGRELARDELITTPMPTSSELPSSTSAPSTTTTSASTTTSAPTTTTTTVTTTTELPTTTMTQVLDPTTTVTLPTDFPTPDSIFRLLKASRKNSSVLEDEEGSGVEIVNATAPRAEAQHMTSSEEPRTTKREIKRRDAMDVDVSSDITILDSAFGKSKDLSVACTFPLNPPLKCFIFIQFFYIFFFSKHGSSSFSYFITFPAQNSRIFQISLKFRTLSSESTNQCIINQPGKEQCVSDICFSHFHQTSEGDVEKFDCEEESSKLNKSSCSQLLRHHSTSSICLGEGNETHCCCFSSNPAEICASEKRNTAELTQLWTVQQIWFLIFGHIGMSGIVLVLVLFYKKTVDCWPMDNIVIPEGSRMTSILLAKSISGLGPSLYFSFPLTFFLLDFGLFIHVKSVKFINNGALALSVFKLVTVPVFVYECFLSTVDLWNKDHEPGYCRFNGAIWQFMV